jgi:hypothetical protein
MANARHSLNSNGGTARQRLSRNATGVLLQLHGSLDRVKSMIALHDLQRGKRGQ